jgi:hypothetical protein
MTSPINTSAKSIQLARYHNLLASDQYIGDICHPIIWARGLSAAEITRLYQQALGTFT